MLGTGSQSDLRAVSSENLCLAAREVLQRAGEGGAMPEYRASMTKPFEAHASVFRCFCFSASMLQDLCFFSPESSDSGLGQASPRKVVGAAVL